MAKYVLFDTETTGSDKTKFINSNFHNRLNELEEVNKLNITIKAHDAIGNVLSKLVVLAKEKFPKTNPMQTIVELTKQAIFIKTFKFGKYKGRSIEEICEEDIGYINWFMKSIELDEDMKYTLDKIMGHVE